MRTNRLPAHALIWALMLALAACETDPRRTVQPIEGGGIGGTGNTDECLVRGEDRPAHCPEAADGEDETME